ncbi:MAG: Asp-tRNA(Asn)/Glu-tRNA(Gln) amidotransferase subunit GatB [Rhodobacteraceae bacterium]|nr:Asp-tRNA(Asn)/Glu-tRNA(Gln) amidotransferase subunit GatB [Paracoccaceae bacterium]
MSDAPAPQLISGVKDEWEMVIGLEVHAQVASAAKLFSCASTGFGAEPNTNVDLVDAAMPGMLPVINEFCIEQAVRTGLGLKAEINRYSVFDRKNYFYPDLPQGYQISQLYHPIIGAGEVDVDMGEAGIRKVNIDHIHLEQDAGKSLHDMDPELSFVDLNRTGVALMEIVSAPDIRSPEEAAAYILKLRQIMRYLGSCDGNMQNGNLRADVNVSVRPKGSTEFGTRCEIKNMNSTRFIQQAIGFEARRQIALLEDGGVVKQETRLFDPGSGKTRSMRSKEEAHDYRYFPCPDLLPLRLEQDWIDAIAASLPELPDARMRRFVEQFGITRYDAEILTEDPESADYFETVATGRDGKLSANWVINELFGKLNKTGLGITESPVAADQLGNLLSLISDGSISGKMAKSLFETIWDDGGDPAEIAERRGMKQVTDSSVLEAAVDAALQAFPDQAEKARQNPRVAGFFVGQVMKATGGNANPKAVSDLVARKLGGG